MNYFGIVGKNQVMITKAAAVAGWTKAVGDRPTVDHVLQDDGTWIIPAETNDDIKEKRKARFEIETDPLLLDIISSRELGQDTTEKTALWSEMVETIKSDLPYLTQESSTTAEEADTTTAETAEEASTDEVDSTGA